MKTPRAEKDIFTLDQLTDFFVEEVSKWSEEQKRECREHLNWSLLYDKKIRWDVIH
jgi:hypothetical protein